MLPAAGRAAASLRRSARSAARPATIRGTAVELTWLAAHVATYPMGVVQERFRAPQERFSLQSLPPVQRGLRTTSIEAAGTPILLVHGIVDNRSVFSLLRRGLRRRGFDQVWTTNYQVWTTDIRAAARRLGATVEAICERTGYEQVHLVGHSMGGLVARYYVQQLGGDRRVDTLVTLGTPHRGTRLARAMPAGVLGQLVPGSDLLRELAGPVERCATRFVCLYSDFDEMVVPHDSGRLDHPDLQVRNIELHGVGHLSMPVDPRVVREVAAALTRREPGGVPATSRHDGHRVSR